MSIKDGGPFHPCEVTWRADGLVDGVQTQNHAGIHTGASLRDHFAGMALQGIIALDAQLTIQVQCDEAYRYADSMLRAREASQ